MNNTHIETYHKGPSATSLRIRPLSKEVTRIRCTAEIPDIIAKNPRLDDVLAEMLKRGSKGYTKEALEEAFAALGTEWSISAEGGLFHISLTARNEAVTPSLHLLKTLLQKPLFLDTELRKLKKEGLQTLHELRDDARYRAGTLFSRLLYKKGDHRYAPDLQSEEKALTAVTRANLRKAHTELLESAWFVSVSGPEKAYSATLSICKSFPKRKKVPKVFMPQPRIRKKVEMEVDHVPQKQNVELFIGGTIPLRPGTPDFTAFSFGIDILGKRGGFAGRLMSTVREKEGLTYGIYAWLSGAHALYAGHYVIGTFFTPKDVKQGIASTLREIRNLREHGVTAKEISKFKRLLLNQYLLAFESGETTLAAYHNAIVMGFSPSYVDEYPKRVANVNAQVVSEVLKRHLDLNVLCFAAAGSIEKIPLTVATTGKSKDVSK